MGSMKALRITLVAAAVFGLWLLPAHALAFDPFGAFRNQCNGSPTGTGEASICNGRANGTNPLVGPNGVFIKVTNVIALVAGFVAVFILFAAGITYITANGEPSKIKQAQAMIMYTVAGILVIVLADSIISYVLHRL